MCSKMKALLLCIFSSGISLVSSQSNEGITDEHNIFCQFTGQGWCSNKNMYIFNIDDVQNALGRCQNIMYATYYFDRRSEVNTHVMEADKNALRPLAQCGKIIYIGIGFIDSEKWSEVFTPGNDPELFNYHVNTLISFLKKYNISGVIIEDIDVFNSEWPFATSDVTAFVTELKSKMESLKVGLIIVGNEYKLYSTTTTFSFDDANTVFDYFFFDVSVLNFCTPETKYTSTNPITFGKNNLITMEQVSKAIMDCKVDKCKAYARLLVGSTELEEVFESNDDSDIFWTLSLLCKAVKSGDDTSEVCFDSTSTLYSQGKFAKDNFAGILMSVMETDDYDCSCGCRPFVGANTILDGWECCNQQPCETIDKLLVK